jgi:Protein of unknown function (DUF992)
LTRSFPGGGWPVAQRRRDNHHFRAVFAIDRVTVQFEIARTRKTTMVRNYLLLATFALGVMFAEQATAQSWTQVGTLSCRVDPNIGFIIVGHQPMQCVYTQAPNAIPQVPPQSYDGALSTIGVALGISTGSVLGWAVFAPTTGVPAGALAGEYVGVSADVGLGAGANCFSADRTVR